MARKILLADDSVTAQNMGRRILTDAGYEVITVNNGSAAIKKINEIKPDLIVLDIYMPGYGGLEICQRIRETPELARIPVLLTVGKLEPFKADDARRVRADAFVIKPFEASELLTALTKLEDKIVPSGQPFSGGRFSRAVASIEQAKAGKEFGDTDTGWKSRLKIPAPYSKPHESHAETQANLPADSNPAAAQAPAPQAEPETTEKHTENVASLLPEGVASALPHNVTPEEIEAIAAAAALLASHADISADAPLGSHRHTDVQQEATREQSTGPTESLPEELVSASFASGTQEQAEEAPASQPEITQATSGLEPEPPPEISRVTAERGPQGQEIRADEVAAMLESLSPASSQPGTAEVEEPVAATIAAAAASGAEYSGRRWIAEPTPVSEEESTLVLQLEMERAFAAFAAADAARMFQVGQSRESGVASWAENAPDVTAEISAPQRNAAPEVQIAVETQADEAAVSGTAEAEGAESEAQDAEEQPPEEEKAAYAVAASAGGSAVSSGVEQTAQDGAVEMSAAAPVSDPATETRNHDLAAAWASWKQVREAAVDSQLGTQADGSAVVEVDEAQHEEPGQTEDAEPTEAEASAEDAREVASIVESVLADLKPKLMKEIAQKMGKGKKKKKND